MRTAIDVLLVEPDAEDARRFTESFADASVANRIHTVTDGEGALEFVHRCGEYRDCPRPDLVFLNWQLPDGGGEEVLAELKGDPELKPIPVLVLTCSDDAADVARSYELNANASVQKPVDPDEFATLVRSIERFWLSVVTLPPNR